MCEECTEFSSSPALFCGFCTYYAVNKRSDVSEKSTSSVFRETKSGSRKPDTVTMKAETSTTRRENLKADHELTNNRRGELKT